jgi:3-deoxy-D-manno-octulosonic-acid transferase
VAAGDALWVHSASAGEFLQARILLRELRRVRPAIPLVLTYTSPSAAPLLERFQGADLIFPLPLDTLSNVRRWLDALRPGGLALVDAEVWPNLLIECTRRGVPTALVSARLAGGAGRLRRLARSFYRELYPLFDLVGCIDVVSAERFVEAGTPPAALRVTGDLRIDETLHRIDGVPRKSALPLPAIVPIVAAGSTWPDDEAVLLPALERLRDRGVFFSLVIAPHEAGEARLSGLEIALDAAGFTPGRLSAVAAPVALPAKATDHSAAPDEVASCPATGATHVARLGKLQLDLLPPAGEAQAELLDALVVDRLGLLYRLYAGAAAAYVGGAFRGALHNVMEPAAFGVPVLTGPRTRKSWLAREMIRAGGLFPVADVQATVAVLEHLLSNEHGAEAGERARGTLLAHAGATERTLRALAEVRWLPQSGADAAISPGS